MKCKVVRHHLLASARPARPPAVVADHLAACSHCRDWHRQLVRMERLVPELPVPPSGAKANCLFAVLHADAFGRHNTGEVEWRRRERALRKVAITFAMAAGLLFFALIWYAWQQQHDGQVVSPGPQPESLYTLDHIVRQYGDGRPLPSDPLAAVSRLEVLATRLHGEASERWSSGTIDEVTILARQFKVLIQAGILPQAQSVPAGARAQILPALADQMSRTESLANRLANQRADVAEPLRDIAVVASNAHLKLLELAKGKV